MSSKDDVLDCPLETSSKQTTQIEMIVTIINYRTHSQYGLNYKG